MKDKPYEVRVIHMASMARSGETMMLRSLSTHPMIRVAGQLLDSAESERRLRFFRTWESQTIPANNEAVSDLDIPANGIVLVKQGIWEHPWYFQGFILARNPLSIYYSLINYDSFFTRVLEHKIHRLGKVDLALQLQGNFERFYRWTNDIDKLLASKFPSMDFLEIFCAFYNRRMSHLLKLDLPIFHYESIVVDPESNLRKLCGHLEIDYQEEMINSHQKFHDVVGHGKNSLYKPISSKSNEKAKQLPVKIRDRILALTQSTWDELGYKEHDKTLVLK